MLRQKYAEERAKRVSDHRGDRLQLPEEYYINDPFAPTLERNPVYDEFEVVIVGGGFGGLLLGARLREIGIDSIRIIDKAADFGGTWYWNRYPGAQCDVESYVYMPLLEEMGVIPTERYAHGPEILAYSQAIGRKYDLYADACFQTAVTGIEWIDGSSRWRIHTNRGDIMSAQFVCLAPGGLHKPKIPNIPGCESFDGSSFHTSRWDYGYTGGDPSGNLIGLADKTVGILGTGASAIQCIPHLGSAAKHLYVFQRTPSAVSERRNQPTDQDWVATLTPGWQRERVANFGSLTSGGYEAEDLVGDGWTDHFLAIRSNPAFGSMSPEERAEASQMADMMKMEAIRGRIDATVTDEATAAALKPYYDWFCKRPCFHDEFLATFNRSNVTLVNTDGRDIELVQGRTVITSGEKYELDCLIYATGFETATEYTEWTGYEVIGVGRLPLSKKWSDGMVTLHGMMASGFPNLMFAPIILRSQFAAAINIPHGLSEYAEHAAFVIDRTRNSGSRAFHVTAEAEEAWVRTVIDRSQVRVDYLKSCTPGYFNNEGKPEQRAPQNVSFGGSTREFFEILTEWRRTGWDHDMELMS